MKKLLEVRLGGGKVRSGLVPFEAFDFFRELMSSLKEEGGKPEDWAQANLHLEILGKGSTKAAILAAPITPLRQPSRKFVKNAARHDLPPRGRRFVIENFKPGSAWEYAEIITGDREPVKVRFDQEYREDLLKGIEPLTGPDEIFAKVIRIGGENPPRVKLEMAGVGSGTYDVDSVKLAKELAKRLYTTVKVYVDAKWHSKTLEVIDLKVVDIDKSWQDVHLADVLRENKGVLPLTLSISDTEELIRLRQEERQ